MDKQRRRYLYNRCKPDVALEPGDDRYIDLDALGVRGRDWVDRLATRIELSDGPTCQLFTGLPGSGKSTELRRLVKRLSESEGSAFEVVYIDAREYLDVNATIDVPDLLLTIVAACERALLEREGTLDAPSLEAALEQGYARRLWDWLTRTDVIFTEMEFGVAKVGKLAAELKTRPALRQRFRETVGAHLNRFLSEIRDELTAMQSRAIDLGRAGLVVVIDSLEQLSGTATTWAQVLASAEQVFGAQDQLTLPIHVIYTVPPALISRKRFDQIDFMPMIKLRRHPREGGERFQAGYDAALELILQRIPRVDFVEMFGSKTEERIEQLIDLSGGYPREIVRLLHEALLIGNLPLSDGEFRRLLNEASDSYRMVVTADSFALLARVAVERYLTLETEQQRETADAMFKNNVILRYLNDDYWFDVHPSVRLIPGVASAIARLSSP